MKLFQYGLVWILNLFLFESSKGSIPQLLYANIKEINSLEIDTWVNETVVPGLSRVISLDYHYSLGLIFWTDVLENKISVIHINNLLKINEDIVRTKISRPDGIAVDWVYDHIYWTDEVYQHIQVSNLDGSMRRTLIDYLIEKPRALALDPENGMMFFSDWGSIPRIERCGLDGNNREVIIKDDIAWPNGLVIDHEDKRLYWADGAKFQIKSAKFDGTNVKIVIKSSKYLPHPFGIALYGGDVYWTNWEYRSLLRTDKYGEDQVEIVRDDLSSPMDLKLYHSSVQQSTGNNVCGYFNGGCSHLCLPSSSWSNNKAKYTCLCPDGYDIESNNKTCIKTSANVELLIAEHQSISKINLESLKKDNLDLTGLLNTVAIDVHVEKDLIFWTDVMLKNIYVSYLSGGLMSGLGIRKVIISENVLTPDGLAVDWIYDHIYWTDTGLNHIQVSNLDGTFRKTLISSRLDEPRAIALFPHKGLMFFTDWGIYPKIERCDMNGDHRLVIVSKDIRWPNGLTIDYIACRIYWTDGYLQTIRSATFDGNDIYTIVAFDQKSWPQPFGIDLYDNRIYWSNWNSKNIYTAHKYRGHDLKPLVTGLHAPRNLKILAKTAQFNGTNLCGINNGGCEHLCLPVPVTSNSKGFTCSCADNYHMEDTNKCIQKGEATLVKEEL